MLRRYFIRCRSTSGVPNIVGWPTVRSKLSVKSVGLPIARCKLFCEFNSSICPAAYINVISISFSKKTGERKKRPKVKTSLIGKECERTYISKRSYMIVIHIWSHRITMNSGTVLWRSWQTGFMPPKGRHIVIKLPVLSVLSVWVFITYPKYISYIILGRNAKIRVLMHLGSWSVTHLYHCHQIQKNRVTSINPRNPKFGLWTHLGVTESLHIQLSDHCDLDFLASVLRKMCCLVLSNDFL